MAGDQTLRQVLWAGVWWPTMKEEVYDFVRTCEACKAKPPHPHATLFQVSIAPKWSEYSVEYLEQRVVPEKVSRARRKAIELESKEYELIGNQLYKKRIRQTAKVVCHRGRICQGSRTSSCGFVRITSTFSRRY